MQYRKLGVSSLKVSALCLGTMTWGRQNSEADGHAQMDFATERGINFLDTAEAYPYPSAADAKGRTESIIGTWMKARRNRDKIILATKVSGRSDRAWLRGSAVETALTRDQIFEAIDASLERLQTDYIDLYQLHFPDRPVDQFGTNPVIYRHIEAPSTPIEETLDALDELVKAGKVREIGISNESAWGAMRYLYEAAINGRPRAQSIQNAYSLLNRTFETNLAELAIRENLSLIAYSALGQGCLTGKYLNGAEPPGARRTLYNNVGRYETPGAPAAVGAYVTLAREAGLDPAQMSLAFVMSRPFVTTTIIGATTLDQLKANIDAFDIALPEEVVNRIDHVHLLHTNPCP